ncbi:MAG: hemolysin [Acidobacteriota bacterium]|jgi:hemolysin III|nr:hemolysin [Acidobacteriota bacterium]
MARVPSPPHAYSLREEIAHGVTHGLGTGLAIIGLAVLVAVGRQRGPWCLAGDTIFGVTLVLLYLASTLYHSIPSPRAKPVLRALDHSAIYLLIAGTYTPFTLVNLRGPQGYALLGLVWFLAIVGILFKVFATGRYPVFSILLYLGMGWSILLALKPLVHSVERGGVALLVAGGLTYTVGIVFYLWRRLPYHHAVWHLFVLAGSIFHYFAVLLYVLPPGSVRS